MDGVRNSIKVKSSDEIADKNFDNSNDGNTKVDFDSILVNEVGQFGWFQLRIMALTMFASFFGACDKQYVFTTGRINTRCLVPECEDASNTVFTTPWLGNALPSSGGSYDSCHQFVNTTDSLSSNHSCPAHLFNTNMTQPCTEFVYENQHTVVYDFDLACKEWMRSFIGFSRSVGGFIGIPIYGFVSDRWGRRTAISLIAFNSAWLGIVRYWANNYVVYTAMEFIEGVFGPNIVTSSYVLVVETVGPKYRTLCVSMLASCYAVGTVALGFVTWAIPDWRRNTLIIFAPQLITISYFWILAESARWYLSKGRYDEAEAALKEAAQINKSHISEKSLQLLQDTVKEDEKKKTLEKAEKAHEPWLPVLVFRHKPILIRCIALSFCWITETMIYQGLANMALTISGNKYINYIAVAAVEIPGYWISVPLMNRLGRKSVLLGTFWLCAVCQAIYIFIPSGYIGWQLAVYLLGKCSIATAGTTNVVYTSELFPTKYRHNLVAFPLMMGRLGSLTGPIMPAISAATFDEMPFVIFGGFALASGMMLLLTPETLGAKLPDTMDDADKLDRKQQAA